MSFPLIKYYPFESHFILVGFKLKKFFLYKYFVLRVVKFCIKYRRENIKYLRKNGIYKSNNLLKRKN